MLVKIHTRHNLSDRKKQTGAKSYEIKRYI